MAGVAALAGHSQPQCLLSPNELTSSARAVTSVSCQEETHAPQHLHLYSITRSARSRNDSGMVRRSAFAVLRLIVSLNLVGNTTGRSAGVPPFGIPPPQTPRPPHRSIRSPPAPRHT